jgi:hypothetical protein
MLTLLGDPQHPVYALQAQPPPAGGRGGDDEVPAQLYLGEGHVVLNRRTADRSHAHHLFSAVNPS